MRFNVFPAFLLGVAVTLHAEPSETQSPAIPKQVLTIDLAGAAASHVNEPNTSFYQIPSEVTVDYLQRHALSGPSLYWNAGFRGDYFSFDNRNPFLLQRLQSYAAQFGLEYFVGSEAVASLTLRPGFYFESDPTLSSWDIPLDFVAGVPIKQGFSGVLGVSAARFYNRPIPVAGFSWTIDPRYRLDLAYPDPALVMKVKKGVEARLAGTLVGNGYRLDSSAGHSKVEYSEYRVGPAVTVEIQPGMKLIGDAGYAVFRRFDFFSESQRFDTGGAPYIHIGVELSR